MRFYWCNCSFRLIIRIPLLGSNAGPSRSTRTAVARPSGVNAPDPVRAAPPICPGPSRSIGQNQVVVRNYDRQLLVRPSVIHGMGLFTSFEIRKDEIFLEYTGEVRIVQIHCVADDEILIILCLVARLYRRKLHWSARSTTMKKRTWSLLIRKNLLMERSLATVRGTWIIHVM